MDGRSVGSRGSLYPELRGDLASLDAPEAIEVFSKGNGGGRASRHRRRDSKGPIGLQIDATHLESFGIGDSADLDDPEKDYLVDGNASYGSLGDSENGDDPEWNEMYIDDELADALEGGAGYGEMDLNDGDEGSVGLRSETGKRASDNRSIGGRSTGVRSIGGASARSSKSVHTNPGVLANDKAPRAKKQAPRQLTAAERLSQFGATVTKPRSDDGAGDDPASGAPRSARRSRNTRRSAGDDDPGSNNYDPEKIASLYNGMSLALPEPRSQIGAQSDPTNPLIVDYKNEFSGRSSTIPPPPPAAQEGNSFVPSPPQPRSAQTQGDYRNPPAPMMNSPSPRSVQAAGDARNPLMSEYKNTFSGSTPNHATSSAPQPPQRGSFVPPASMMAPPMPRSAQPQGDTRNPLMAAEYKNTFGSSTLPASQSIPNSQMPHMMTAPMPRSAQNTFNPATSPVPQRSSYSPMSPMTASPMPRSSQGAVDQRNPLMAEYKNTFSPEGTRKHVSAGQAPPNSRKSAPASQMQFNAQGSNGSQMQFNGQGNNAGLRPAYPQPPPLRNAKTSTQTRTSAPPSSLAPPAALQRAETSPAAPTSITERRKFESALKNLHSNPSSSKPAAPNPSPPQAGALPKRGNNMAGPPNPALNHPATRIDSRMDQAGMVPGPGDVRSRNRQSTTQEQPVVASPTPKKKTAAKNNSSWGRSPLEAAAVKSPTTSKWGRSPLQASPAGKNSKKKEASFTLPPMQTPMPTMQDPMMDLIPPPAVPSTKKTKEKAKSGIDKSATLKKDESGKPRRNNSFGSLGALVGFRRGKDK